MALRYSANLSMLYNEVAFLDRFARAAASGFVAVEFLFPYKVGVEAVQARLDDFGLKVALFNLNAGETAAGEWGTLSNPAQRDYFRWSFSTGLEAASRLGFDRLNMTEAIAEMVRILSDGVRDMPRQRANHRGRSSIKSSHSALLLKELSILERHDSSVPTSKCAWA